MRDHRIGPDLFTGVLDVLRGHGFVRGDDEHAGRALLLIRDLARIYEGTQDHPSGPPIYQAPSLQTTPEPPSPDSPDSPDSRDTVTIPASDRKTLLIALDIAADDRRDRTQLCTDCPDQSCPACQSRLRDARAYDQLADRIFHGADTTPAAHHRQAEPPRPARQSSLEAGKEAGQ
jgi:hypothetical protein